MSETIAEYGFTLIEWTGALFHNLVDFLVSTPSIGQTFPERSRRRAMKRKMYFRRIRDHIGLKRKRPDQDEAQAKRQRVPETSDNSAHDSDTISSLQRQLACWEREGQQAQRAEQEQASTVAELQVRA